MKVGVVREHSQSGSKIGRGKRTVGGVDGKVWGGQRGIKNGKVSWNAKRREE